MFLEYDTMFHNSVRAAFLLILLPCLQFVIATRVQSVSPNKVGYAGGDIEIKGEGFSDDQFSQFNRSLGNRVVFVNGWSAVVCSVNVYKTSSSRIICNVGPRGSTELSTWYSLRLFVDGQLVTSAKRFSIQFHDSLTPYIDDVEPRWAPSGSVVTIRGRFFTSEFGVPSENSSDALSSSRTVYIDRVRVGGHECDTRDLRTGELMPATDSAITCRTSSSVSGPLSVNIIVAGKGNSRVRQNMRPVSANGRIYDFMSMPEITMLTPATVPTSGGSLIQLTGRGFVRNDTMVTLGGADCSIVTLTPTNITCLSPAASKSQQSSRGEVGVDYQVWLDTEVNDLSEVDLLTESSPGYRSEHLMAASVDNDTFGQSNSDSFVGRMSGWLRVSSGGRHQMVLKSDGAAQLKMGVSPSSVNSAPVVTTDGDFTREKKSEVINGTQSGWLYFEATHRKGDDGRIRIQVGMIDLDSPISNDQTKHAIIDKQVLYIKGKPALETQVLEFHGFSSSGSNVRLMYGGVHSDPISIADSSNSTWRSAVMEIFTSRCQYSQATRVWLQTFEDGSIVPGHETGHRHNESVTAWSGRRYLYKPWAGLWWSRWSANILVDVTRYPWFCAAHWGTISGTVKFDIEWYTSENQRLSKWLQIDPAWPSGQSWSYSCVDIVSSVQDLITDRSNFRPMRIRDIRVPFNWKDDVYFDDVSFSTTEITVLERTVAPPNGENPLFVREVEVDSHSVNSQRRVQITLHVAGCAANLQLFHVVDETSVAHVSNVSLLPADISDFKTFRSAEWGGQAWVTVNRTSAASGPPEGTWDISLNQQSVNGVWLNLTRDDMERLLVTQMQLSGIRVNRWGECNSYHWEVSFRGAGGIQPDLVVNSSQITYDGTNLQVGVWKHPSSGDGGLRRVPLSPDMLATNAGAVQTRVSVQVGGVPALCSASTCNIGFDESLSVVATSVTAAADVTGNTTLTVSGLNFGDFSDTVTVIVESEYDQLICTLITVTSNEITCYISYLSSGVYNVTVRDKNKGESQVADQLNALPNVSSVQPSSGSAWGGSVLTLRGSKFPSSAEKWRLGVIKVGSAHCDIISSTSFSVICRVNGRVGSDRELTNVNITMGSASTIVTNVFTALSNASGTVDRLNVTTSSASGGAYLGIFGSHLGSCPALADCSVFIGARRCPVVTWQPSLIVCVLPANTQGSHAVKVLRGAAGYADTSAISDIQYIFFISSITPRVVSLMGGAELAMTGGGWGTNCDQLLIKAGDEMLCSFTRCSESEIECRLELKRRHHVIRSTGHSYRYGAGFQWEPQHVTVRPGDLVTWWWSGRQATADDTGFSVYQTSSQQTDQYDGSGFNSGAKSIQGSYTTVFNDIGTVYYSGHPVISTHIRMRGVIHVTAGDSTKLEMNVNLGSIAASYMPQLAAPTSIPTTNLSHNVSITDQCGQLSASADQCPTADLSVADLYADNCVTPIVTSIQPFKRNNSYEITGFWLEGRGFPEDPCHITVLLANSSCPLVNASSSHIFCQLEMSGFPSGGPVSINVHVRDWGDAVNQVPNRYKYFTSTLMVDQLAPERISPYGGGQITLTGKNLIPAVAGSVAILIGSQDCHVISNSLSRLVCVVPEAESNSPAFENDPGVEIVAVTARVIEGSSVRSYVLGNITYDKSVSPSVNSITPSSNNTRRSINVVLSGRQNITNSSVFSLKLSRAGGSRTRRATGSAWRNSGYVFADDVLLPDPSETHTEDRQTAWNFVCDDQCDGYEDIIGQGKIRVPGSAKPFLQHSHTKSSPLSSLGSLSSEGGDDGTDKSSKSHSRKTRQTTENQQQNYEISCFVLNTTSLTTELECDLDNTPAGQYNARLISSDLGGSETMSALSVQASVSTDTLRNGSVHGGAVITLSGHGFIEGETTVDVGISTCVIIDVSSTEITCQTPAGSGGQELRVIVGNQVTAGPMFYYDLDITPELNSVSTDEVDDASLLYISGANLKNSSTSWVEVRGQRCLVTFSNSTYLTCEISPQLSGGMYNVTFRSPDGPGDSNTLSLSVPLSISSVSPSQGGLLGTYIDIRGGKFDTVNTVTVTLCNMTCHVIEVTSTLLMCRAPAVTDPPAGVCNVEVSSAGGSVRAIAAFTYRTDLTASVTSVTPTRGGTAGGTTIVITGTGFGPASNTVHVGGSSCVVTEQTNTEITCVTEAHAGPGSFTVEVDVPGTGIAQTNVQFEYIDRWSSVFTWGGENPPTNGESVHITAGQTILLDTSTPVLKLVLITGGKLIFDSAQPELELNAEYILVLDGGSVQVGTEDTPYPSKATITLHGNVRATELPVYGAKVLAVRNGTLDLHGLPVPVTWTHLARTASAGDTQITLTQPVTWQPGDEIVIATTGDKLSAGQSEKKTIESISQDGVTVTLTSSLRHQHISETVELAGRSIQMRAEVGLLTRNVKVRGSINEEFTQHVKECAAGFQPGQFDVQTCFHGRYGDETVTDQFGATIMLHAKYQHQHLVTGRLQYVEVTEAGQAFRLGRYPIHFHLNGNVTGSYVRGCAIHRTYNRAVTIHAVDHLLVEHNVAYDNMGHAFFTEDGIEQYNVIQYNLAVFTRTSSSLLNVDVTPASFWVVNPTNIVRHNAAAGGTHFGFWYRTEAHPSGPSFTSSYCPNHAPMAEFRNNSAHSFGRYGLWVFSMDGYFPKSGSDGTCAGDAGVARFGSFFAWRCERGAEVVLGGALRFENFTVVDNEKSGLEMVKMSGTFGNNGPGVENAFVVGRSGVSGNTCTERGIITPKQNVFNVDGATFVNFDGECAALGGCSQCKLLQGGFSHQFRGLQFVNSPNKLAWKWTHESVFLDTDGSLSGIEDSRILPWMDTLPESKCSRAGSGLNFNSEVPSAICTNLTLHRMAFNSPLPRSMLYKRANFTTRHGSTLVEWKKKRLTHPSGWMALLAGDEDHLLSFEDLDHLTNISYTATLYGFGSSDSLSISHAVLQQPDRISIGESVTNGSAGPLDLSAGHHGDISWDNSTFTFSYLVSGRSRSTRNPGPFLDRAVGVDRPVRLSVYRCYFEACTPPPPPIVPAGRPDTAQMWSQDTQGVWTVPDEMTDVTIPAGLWVVADVQLPPMGRLMIYGVLEIEDDKDNILNCTHIIVFDGKLIAGSKDSPFQHSFTILLRGRHQRGVDGASQDIPMPSGTPNIGWKSLAVFGGLQLYGRSVHTTWTCLNSTSLAGSSTLHVQDQVSWRVGDELVISSSSHEPAETEVRRVAAVTDDGRSITVNESLRFDHIGEVHTMADGMEVRMAAKVGLLSHNIRIEGETYNAMFEESFGARVLASGYFDAASGTVKKASVALQNVEFRLSGQEGWTESFDPRFALAFVNLGDTDSYVLNCSFNHVFSPALGLFSTNNMTFRGNVIVHTVGSAIIDQGSDNRLHYNLITWLIFPGTYNGRNEPENLSWDAGFQVNKARNLSLIGNVVAGSERIGFHIDGTECTSQAEFSNNEVHASLHGVHLFSQIQHKQCSKISGFFVWRSYDFGIYMNIDPVHVIISNNVLVENTLGILSILFLPNPVSHQFADKTVQVLNTSVVAVAGGRDYTGCSLSAPTIAQYRTLARAPRASGVGRTGLMWAQFIGSRVGAPKKPWHVPMSYSAVRGSTMLDGVHFYNFDGRCGGRKDVAISTLQDSDDAQHPMIISRLIFSNVSQENKLFLHRPVLARVNPSDCVDMDCDGQKHAMIIDTDGSIIGSSGTILPEAEFEFDGDPRRGVGYYRVPETAVTRLDGSRIPYTDKMPNKGIWRNVSCQQQTAWRAYTCPGGTHRMLVIESMDADTEVRRVSPIALIADPGPNGYVDLLNGPQDHGWCFGYTCQERLSTFYAIVASGKLHEVHFTGTPPQHLRFHYLNTDQSHVVLLKIWYPKPQRYDVYLDGEFVSPKNRDPNSTEFKLLLDDPNDPDKYVPSLTAQNSGENYFHRDSQFVYVLVRGTSVIEIRQQPVIVLKMGFVGIDNFFEANVLSNLADLLGLRADQIRVTRIVREDGGNRRRRRNVAATQVEFEIGDAPGGNNSSGDNNTNTGASSNTTGSSTESLDFDTLQQTQALIADTFQSGEAESALGVSLDSLAMVDPDPVVTDPTRGVRATNETGGTDLSGTPGVKTYAEIQREMEAAAASERQATSYQRPASLVLGSSPVSQQFEEFTELQPMPYLYMLDTDGNRMTSVGHSSRPWVVTAELVNPPAGVFLLHPNASFQQGFANFSQLQVSGSGQQMTLMFRVVQPANVSFSVRMTGTFSTTAKSLQLKFSSGWAVERVQPSSAINPAPSVYLYDPSLSAPARASVLRDLQWTFTLDLYGRGVLHNATLLGTTRVQITQSDASLDGNAPVVQFTGVSIATAGWRYQLVATVSNGQLSSNSLSAISRPFAVQASSADALPITRVIGLRFSNSFSTISDSPDTTARFTTALLNWLQQRYPRSAWVSAALSQGSIRVAADTRSASMSDHETTVSALSTDMNQVSLLLEFEGRQFVLDNYLQVDGADHVTKKKRSGIGLWMLLVIMLPILLISTIIAVCLCYLSKKQQQRHAKAVEPSRLAFTVPAGAAQNPPFGSGNIDSFTIRMAIYDPRNRIAPSVIHLQSDGNTSGPLTANDLPLAPAEVTPATSIDPSTLDPASYSSPQLRESPRPESGTRDARNDNNADTQAESHI